MYQLTKEEKKEIKQLVEVINDDLFTGTFKLSKLFNLEHNSLKRLVKRYLSDFEDVGESEIKKRDVKMDFKSTLRSRKMTEFLLNEPQAMLLILYSKNKDIVKKFKNFITKEFFRQRKLITKLLAQKQNAEWLKLREEGKFDRLQETDEIKKFIEYAYEQGSKKAKEYYRSISKMVNSTLFYIEFLEHKYPNLRDVLDRYQLVTLQNADRIIARALKEGMEKRMYYKDIYKLAKSRIESFVDLVGKSKPMSEEKKIPQNIANKILI